MLLFLHLVCKDSTYNNFIVSIVHNLFMHWESLCQESGHCRLIALSLHLTTNCITSCCQYSFYWRMFFRGKLKESSVIRHNQKEEMMQNLKLNQSLLYQLLVFMVLALLQVLHTHRISRRVPIPGQWAQCPLKKGVNMVKLWGAYHFVILI